MEELQLCLICKEELKNEQSLLVIPQGKGLENKKYHLECYNKEDEDGNDLA